MLARQFGYELERKQFIVGQEIGPTTILNNGCYAICSRKDDLVLRISLIQGIAALYLDNSRYLRQAWIL
jgi:hypothetical protein